VLHALDYDLLEDSLAASAISSLTESERRKNLGRNYRVYQRDRRGKIYQPITVERPRRWWERFPWA